MFSYDLNGEMLVFYDCLKAGSPYTAKTPRKHDSIFLVKKGQMLYEKQGEKTVIGEGQVGYISRGSADKSGAYLCDETAYIAVNFNFDGASAGRFEVPDFDTLCSHGNAYGYDRLFDELFYMSSSELPGKAMICRGLFLQIIGCLYNEHKTDVAVLRKMKRIENAVDHLRAHFGDPALSVARLAEIANMSEKNFRRVFADAYRQTPYAYLQEYRLARAETLLRLGTSSVSDIALQCGFSDVYSFSHSFKNKTGISPTEYVKRQA